MSTTTDAMGHRKQGRSMKMLHQAAGETVIVKQSGLHLIPEKAYPGASSDSLVTCSSVDTCCQGCLETKCPYSIVEMSPLEIADRFRDKFFF